MVVNGDWWGGGGVSVCMHIPSERESRKNNKLEKKESSNTRTRNNSPIYIPIEKKNKNKKKMKLKKKVNGSEWWGGVCVCAGARASSRVGPVAINRRQGAMLVVGAPGIIS